VMDPLSSNTFRLLPVVFASTLVAEFFCGVRKSQIRS
jgi:hypothetical protein